MQYNYLYNQYFQKSLNYLYPLLGIDKDEVFIPAGCYLWWNGDESIDDFKLIVDYTDTQKKVFDQFERRCLLKNPYFDKCYNVETGKVYIFDLSSYQDTVKHFLKGKYSQFSDAVKRKVMKYHGAAIDDKEVRPGRYIHMSLYPELYHEHVANELETVPLEEIKKVKELINVYDKKKETLEIRIVGECQSKQLVKT